MSRKVAIVEMPLPTLSSILFRETEIKLLHARPSFDNFGEESVVFLLEHPDLEAVPEGYVAPKKRAIFTVDEGTIKVRFEDDR